MGNSMSKAARQVIWDEALRTAAERGRDPEGHLRAMIQETMDSLVADGLIETAGLNAARERWSTAR
jgi:hypothetical protein